MRITDVHNTGWQLQHPKFVCKVEKLDVVDRLFLQREIFDLTEKLDVPGFSLQGVMVQECLRLISDSRVLQSWD